jgi:hypothetical protein
VADTEESDFQKGDYVRVTDTGEQGQIAGPASSPGSWQVVIIETGKPRDVPESLLEPEY